GTAALPGGCRRIVWDPTLDHPNRFFPELKFYLSVISTNVEPDYLVINLVDGDIEYKDEYFAEEVNADLYKTEKMAFRYIPPGTFTMGIEGSGKATTLTKGFYMGVFEVTQEQWRYVTGGYPGSRFTAAREMRPAETVSYNDIRGTSAGTNWPAGSSVDTNSFLGILRSRTLIDELDLPTEAQSEYACRAGTTTYYSDGEAAAPNDGVSLNTGESNAFINVLGRYKYNGGNVWTGSKWDLAPVASGPANGTAIVGSYPPNAWGLYDVHGNVHEWVLDRYAASLTGGVDPVGAAVGSSRVERGGSWNHAASSCRSAYRYSNAPSFRSYNNGFRLVRTLP
ncbi:MAG: formylglycine-generating enzyme family protein, partial [Lentisphaerae bacterium]|nr:formylglycine-generating enzyme family protein [Lentisphaerota bacterium]